VEPKVNILLVDDQPANLLALEAVLEPLGQNLVRAASGKDALRLLEQGDFAVVLLDLQMPGLDGFATAQRIRGRERSRHTPLIFITGYDSDSFPVAQAYQLGAVDYLVKPLVPAVLRAKVDVFVKLFQKTEQVRELTGQRLAQEALRESEERLRTLSDNLPRGAVYRAYPGPDGRTHFAYISGGVERLFGVRPDEVVRDPASLFGLIHEDDLARVQAAEEAALAGMAAFDCEFRQWTRGGELRWVHCRSAPRRLPDGTAVWEGVVLDVTDRKAAEEALREADRRKDEFLAMLAHELRNPLAPLLNGLHLLRQSETPPEACARARDMMARQLRHLTHLVNDLLDVSRILRGKVQLRRERLDLARLARTTAEDRRPGLEQAGLALRLEAPETPVWVAGDETRLAQVLTNLLDNAAKFSDGGRHVTVRVRADAGRRQAVLSVRDEGIGIEAEVLPRLFNPFAQADRTLERSRGGLGLGLALVKGLTELHGGEVRAASEGPGRGAEFTVVLPLAPEPEALAARAVAPRPAARPRRVLVVEDNRDAADSLRLLLGLLGHEVRVAYTGPEGVEAAREWRPDTVVCDIGLPGLDGYGVARELRRGPATARARLLALTGYGHEDDRRRALEAGFDHHLVKPADPEELQRLLAAG
jgi:PAS domain S-box-containing protein